MTVLTTSIRHWLDLLLTTNRRTRFQLLQTLVAIFVMVSGLAGLLFLESRDIVSAQAVARWSAVSVPGWFAFFAAIRFGLTRNLADPSMTAWQMTYGIVCCAAGYAITGSARGAIFPILMIVMMFNVFSLTPRVVGALSVGTLALFAAVMAWRVASRPDVYPAAIEQIHFWTLATMMPVVVILAARLFNVRDRLRERSEALEVALERNRILATRDELTGLINRRQLLELAERDRHRVARSEGAYCVAMIDLDHFKRVNDDHGHAAGDVVLKTFAHEASQLLRGGEALGRWGGEEFLLLPDAASDAACEGVERLRRAWSGHRIVMGDRELDQTFSAGLVQSRRGETVEQTIERADAALYRAKSDGRNRVVCAS